jgi:signal transduction histidine kinase
MAGFPDNTEPVGHTSGMPARVAMWTAVLLLGAGTLAVNRGSSFTFVGTTVDGTVALLAAGWAPMVVGLVHVARRPGDRMGPLLVLTGAVWFLAAWDTPAVGSWLVFSLGLVTFAAVPAVVAHVTLAYPTGRLGAWPARLLVGTGYLVVIGVVAVLPAVFLDPAAQGCAGCAGNLWLVSDRPDLVRLLGPIGMRAGLAWAVVVVVAVGWRLARASVTRRRVVGGVSLAGMGVLLATAGSYANALERGQLGTTALDRRLWLAQSIALVGLAAAVGWGLLRSRHSQRALARLVVDLDQAAPAGGLRAALAARLGDPGLLLAYRLRDGRWVDALGHPVALSGVGPTQVTPLDGGAGSTVLVHRAGLLDSPDLVEELRSAMGLGLENERLHALALTQLLDLRASRGRLIEAGDAERRRLERDLHDGAQQHLVGLLLALRLQQSRPGAAGATLAAAEAELRRAVDDLRELARGLYPVVLHDEGLPAALRALGETRNVSVNGALGTRLPLAMETTGYLLVARIAAGTAARVTVDLALSDAGLVVDVRAAGAIARLGEVEDRVVALGGRFDRFGGTVGADGRSHLTVTLPTTAAGPETVDAASWPARSVNPSR